VLVRADLLLPKLLGPSAILEAAHVARLEAGMPQAFRGYDWALLFSTTRDGCDLAHMYRCAQSAQASILLVKTTKGAALGAFITEPIRISPSYFGTGEMFVFTLEPQICLYPWSKRNSYFCLCNEDSLAIGGGGEFGIYLDEDLQSGSTGQCETFDNPPLAPSTELDLALVELWTLKLRQR
jgi:hypothetical protein